MTEKKGSDLKVFFVVFVLVILAAVLAYFYLYMPKVDERDALLRENHALETRLIELKNLAVNEQDFIDGINDSKESIQQVLNNYSAGNTPEKSIMMINSLEKKIGIKLPNLSFSEPRTVTTVDMPMVSQDEAGKYVTSYYKVSLLQETLTTNYECDYEQLKDLVDFVHDYPERMNIESITMAYDSTTGGLKGNLVLNLYAVTGTGKEYVAPDISGLSMGVGNIFEQ